MRCLRAEGTIYGQYLGSDKKEALSYLLDHKKDLSELKYIFGHIPFNVHKTLGYQEATYAVVLRNPKHRLLSQLRQGFKENDVISTEDVSSIIREKKIIDNCQVRMTAGCMDPEQPCDDKMLSQVLENLKTQYTYIGFQEHLSHFIHTVLDGEESPSILFLDRNVSGKKEIQIARPDVDVLQDSIGLDIQLFTEAFELFGRPAVKSRPSMNDYFEMSEGGSYADIVYGVMPDTLLGKSTGIIPANIFHMAYQRFARSGLVIEEA